jgi:hypothetical protein
MLSRRLGGSGTEPGSPFTQCLSVNRGSMRVAEGNAYDAVMAGETVYYVVALGYHGRVIPDKVSLFGVGSRGSAGQGGFANVC